MSRIFELDDRTSVEYPNATHFAFVPAIIKVAGVPVIRDGVSVSIIDDQTGKQYREFREPFSGGARFDIRRYLQIMFGDLSQAVVDYGKAFVDSPVKKTATVSVALHQGEEQQEIISFKIDALWGGISAGESSGGVFNRRWFTNYPFTFDLFTQSGDALDVRVDGKSDPGVEFVDHAPNAIGATPFRRRLVNPAHLFDASQVEQSIHVAAPHSLVLKNDTERTGLTAYTLTVDRCDSGVYLRWIDRQGRYCYYLFKLLGTAAATTISASWERNTMTTPTAYVGGQNIETPAQQSLTTKPTISIGAKLIDSETFDFLLTATRSPIVDVFDGYDGNTPMWHRVNIVAGNYTKTTKNFQDFTMTIEQPVQTSQTL